MTSRDSKLIIRASRRGFTLVELLVVITIIGILAGLALVALGGVPGAVQDTAVKTELVQISTALEQYKSDGSFPPDCSNVVGDATARTNAVNRHLNIKYPQRARSLDDPSDSTNGADTIARLKTLGTEINLVNPNATASDAFTFGRLDPTETYVLFLMGFSPDVERPLTGPGERTRLFEFDETRLIDPDNDGWWAYKPRYNDSEIVYFNSKSYVNSSGTVASIDFNTVDSIATGVARPYAMMSPSNTLQFANSNTFQLMSAGRDGNFGRGFGSDANGVKIYPSGLASSVPSGAAGASAPKDYTLEDFDNIANFTEGSTLEADEDL